MTGGIDAIEATTAVVIPAFNAGPHLAGVIDDTARRIPIQRIIVVDDGSTDDTRDVAEKKAVVVLGFPKNQGKGAALEKGIRKAFDMGMTFAITLDADGQHDPAEIPAFLEKQAVTGADIIVGDRMADRADMPGDRVFANRATSWFVSLRTGTHVPDSQNGYRMIRTALFVTLRIKAKRYAAESEFLIRAAKAGASIESVPVKTIYATEVSSVNPYVDTLRFLKMAIKSLFW
jgi:glycosyltransferase involved in cell wall biosynthesis